MTMFSTPYERAAKSTINALKKWARRGDQGGAFRPYESEEPHVHPPSEFFEHMRAHLDSGGRVTTIQREALGAWERGETCEAVYLSYIYDPEYGEHNV